MSLIKEASTLEEEKVRLDRTLHQLRELSFANAQMVDSFGRLVELLAKISDPSLEHLQCYADAAQSLAKAVEHMETEDIAMIVAQLEYIDKQLKKEKVQ